MGRLSFICSQQVFSFLLPCHIQRWGLHKTRGFRRSVLMNNAMSSSTRPRKQRAACDRCHALKNRCSPSGSGDNKCDRCHRLGIRCVYSLKAPLGRPKSTSSQAQPVDLPTSNAYNGLEPLATLDNNVSDDFSMTTTEESLFMPSTPPSLQLGLDMGLTFRPTSPLSYQASPAMQSLPDTAPAAGIHRKPHAEGELPCCTSKHFTRVNNSCLETPSPIQYSISNLVIRPPSSMAKRLAPVILGGPAISHKIPSNYSISFLIT